MQDDKLYLDAELTLQKLSDASGVSTNYLSQVLNETLKVNFFDFVNHWRIEAAKARLLAGTESVLHIALEVGFNARSSFYKAFKKETGLTPSEYRRVGK
nr:AraC family transcriptional regulator [Pseudoalteromonas sp. XMcav2-N]